MSFLLRLLLQSRYSLSSFPNLSILKASAINYSFSWGFIFELFLRRKRHLVYFVSEPCLKYLVSIWNKLRHSWFLLFHTTTKYKYRALNITFVIKCLLVFLMLPHMYLNLSYHQWTLSFYGKLFVELWKQGIGT